MLADAVKARGRRRLAREATESDAVSCLQDEEQDLDAAGVRCFPAGKYLIYYRRVRRGTEILHISTAVEIGSALSKRQPSASPASCLL
jgi:hypothetical protein